MTSARRVSCLSVRLKDKAVTKFEDKNEIKSITINFQKTKGKSEYAYMTKTIDINENDPTICFVKYFVKYMESAHGTDLLNFNKNNLSKEQKLKKVFNISKFTCSDLFS